MSLFLTIPVLVDDPIPQKIRDAAKHARDTQDFRWLRSASEVFLRLAQEKYSIHEELSAEWNKYDRKNFLWKMIIRFFNGEPNPVCYEGHDEALRHLNYARQLMKAALSKDLSFFFCSEDESG